MMVKRRRTYIPPAQDVVNVMCIKCECWMWVKWTKKTDEGYICFECLKEEDDNQNL